MPRKMKNMDLSVIVLSCNTKDITKKCLSCIVRSEDRLKKEVIVIDNASGDGSVDMIKKNFPKFKLIVNKKNNGFAGGNIQGVKIAKGRYILLLNSDAFISQDSLEKSVKFMDNNPKCGIIGARLIDKYGKPQHAARNFPTPWKLFVQSAGLSKKPFYLKGIDDERFKYNCPKECDWVPGCYYLMRKDMIDQIRFFDPIFYLYCEEIDLCLRAKRAGWKIFFYPEAEVIHLGGQSSMIFSKVTAVGKQIENLKIQSELIYFRKNHGILVIFEYLFLDFFLNVILALKYILNGKLNNCVSSFNHIMTVCKVLFLTRFGKFNRMEVDCV